MFAKFVKNDIMIFASQNAKNVKKQNMSFNLKKNKNTYIIKKKVNYGIL